MKVEQLLWKRGQSRHIVRGANSALRASLVFAFGHRMLLADAQYYQALRECYPDASILLCSTAGEIIGTSVHDESIAITAVEFEHTALSTASVSIGDFANSFAAGAALGAALPHSELAHVFVISDGQKVNGSDLIEGLKDSLPPQTIVTGGLAGDGNCFEQTLVGINEPPTAGTIVAVGLYGSRIQIGYGSEGGWDPFGPERLITKATSNVLYELDGYSALDLYTRYLGDQANNLPGSALLFPLSIRHSNGKAIVRTVLSVDEHNKSMTFAGEMPAGWYARFMKANSERLIDGASQAARNSLALLDGAKPELAILISCVGRKGVLGQRVEEEVEGVGDMFDPSTAITGFYSYGEISSSASETGVQCYELHNQTMTITAFREI